VSLFLGVWLVGWGFGEVSAITAIIGSGHAASVVFVARWQSATASGGSPVRASTT
jgi:hypothetical protein